MKLRFDNTIKVAGIGMVPWTRLGPERWLLNYKILSLYDWDQNVNGGPEVIALHTLEPSVRLAKMNSQSLVDEPAFQRTIREKLPDFAFMTYKPVKVPEALSDLTFLASDQALAQRLENKALFRTMMAPLGIPFPPFTLWDAHALRSADPTEVLAGGERILQDETLSGGKGTFRIGDKEALDSALDSIHRLRGDGKVVLSQIIPNARERSLQCCITRHGIFVGPLQKQIVANPLLANLNVVDGDRFCGAEVGFEDECAGAYEEMKKYALIIGEKARSMGYRGIYGIDFLLDDSNVYVLEMNPRITGVTPLLTMLYRENEDIPFYLLHILELLDIDYELEDPSSNPVPAAGSLLVAHTQANQRGILRQTVNSGLYDYDTFLFQKQALGLDAGSGKSQLLIQQYVPEGSIVKPGGRIAVAYANRPVLDVHEELLPHVHRQVQKINDMTIIE